jgi:hypothetical protein
MTCSKNQMKIRVDDSKVELAHNQTLTINAGLGMTVTCVRGLLWITQNNDQSDVILGSGESFTVSWDGITCCRRRFRGTRRGGAASSRSSAEGQTRLMLLMGKENVRGLWIESASINLALS